MSGECIAETWRTAPIGRRRRSVAAIVGVGVLLGAAAAAAQPTGQPPPAAPAANARIEALLRDGWEVAGYVAASDIRTLVLLRHKANPWLVQCSVLIDVTRQPRQVITCYELR